MGILVSIRVVKMKQVKLKTESPCIRSCCLDSNDICLGCHRTLNEILNWAKSAEEDKQLIIAKCELRKHQLNQ